MSNLQTDIPLINVPLSTADGRANPIWFQFFVQLWRRTGNGQGSSPSDLRVGDIDIAPDSVSADLQSAIDDLTETNTAVQLAAESPDISKLSTALNDANALIRMLVMDDGITSQQAGLISKIVDLSLILDEAQDVAKKLRQAVNDIVIDGMTPLDPIRSMAYQDASSVKIKGGSVDGTTVGATSQNSGAFTSVTVTTGKVLVGATTASGYGGVAPTQEVYGTGLTSSDADGGTLALYANTNTASAGAALVLGSKFLSSAFATYARVRGVKNNGTNGDYGGGLAFDTRANSSNFSEVCYFDSNGNGSAGADNTQTWGTPSKRWSVIYAATGAINTSDAREKTPVSALTDAEVAAAMELSNEIGTYQFLSAVALKGDAARHHIGMTVQRAIEIMQAHGLDPMRYGFICHDNWAEEIKQHEPVVEFEDTGTLGENGDPLMREVVISPALTEVIPAGDRYSFRYDELGLFISRGLAERIKTLEKGLS
jgi:hypothetical protein